MKDIDSLFFELIRVAIGTQGTLSRLPSVDEWGELYKMAKKQSLVGICFAGLQRLGADADEGFERVGMSEKLYLTWMGMAVKIQQRNEKVDRQCVELQMRLAKDGFRSCILKGQGVARLYKVNPNLNLNDNLNIGLAGLRQSGDIDVWMDGGFERVNGWVQKVAPTNVVNQHHVDLDMFKDTDVEAHYHPINMTNPWRQRVLKRFIREHEDSCLSCVNNGSIHTPTREFNLVFLMVHIFHHLFTEGVGLRQLMDYYFVLRNTNCHELPTNYSLIFKQLGLERFASALMWVIKTVFVGQGNENLNLNLNLNHNLDHNLNLDLGDNIFLWTPDEKDGRFLLEEIIRSGNFGKQDERQKGLYDSKWNSFWMVNSKTFRFWRFDHWAWFWSPVERIRGYAWRRVHGYRQY